MDFQKICIFSALHSQPPTIALGFSSLQNADALFAVVVVPSVCLAPGALGRSPNTRLGVFVTNLEESSERYRRSPELHIF